METKNLPFLSDLELQWKKQNRLEAAAPDLLAALEQAIPLLVAHANLTGEGVSTLQVARAAIAKAVKPLC